VLVVADELHGDLTFPGHAYTPFSTIDATNVITCLSPAKSFIIASCCSAFTVIAVDDRRAAFQAENSRLTVIKNNAFANVAMQAAWQDGGPWLAAVLQYIEGNLAFVHDRLAKTQINLIEPDGTFLPWLDFRQIGLSSDDLTAFLRNRAGWTVTCGPAFGDQGIESARLNIDCRRAVLGEALERLTTALAGMD